MIDAGLPASRQDWPTASLLLSDWEQGDVLERPPFFYFADPSAAIWELTRVCSGQPEGVLELYEDERPRFGMITTQTCDICEEDSDPPKRPWVSVAPVFEVTESGYKKLVTKCTGPRYWFWIPGIEEAGVWAADLRVEVPVEKGWLASQTRIVGFPDQESRQKLRERLAWIKGRPAFSSGFNSAVAIPLHVALRELIRSEGGLAELALDQLDEIAVSIDDYLAPSWARLTVITVGRIASDLEEWFQRWLDDARAGAANVGIDLFALDFRTPPEVTLEEYRRMNPIWTR